MQCREYIFDNIDKVDFRDEIILSHPKSKYYHFYQFVTEIKEEKQGYFDLENVKGSDHSRYVGKTWLEAVTSLRSQNVLDSLNCTEKRPTVRYYDSDKHRKDAIYDPWTIDIINGGYAYILEGNHRTIIAKFLSAVDVIPKKVSAEKLVRYTQFNESACYRFERFRNWFKSLDEKFQNGIILEAHSKEIENTMIDDRTNIIKYKTVYYAVFEKFVNLERRSEFEDFGEMKQEIFSMVRDLKYKYRFHSIFFRFLEKIKKTKIISLISEFVNKEKS